MRRWLLLPVALLLLPPAQPALSEPVPVTMNMTEDWTGAPSYFRDPAVLEFRGKVYLFWEGDDPSGAWPGYHGNMYYRTYEDSGGVTSLGEVITLTPSSSPFEGEHRNEKIYPIVFKDRLYLVWNSADRAQVPDGNVGWVEILVKYFDGERWSENFMVNAPVEPYNLSQRGANQFATAAVHDGRLYIAWERNVQHPVDGVPRFYSDIWLRSTDGGSWDAPRLVSSPTLRDYNECPVLRSFAGRLFIGWEQVDFRDPSKWSWKMLVRTFDGTALGPLVEVASATNPGTKDSYPRMLPFDNPRTGRAELYLIWRVVGTGGFQFFTKAAIVYSVFDGTEWSEVREAASVSVGAGGGVGASNIGRMDATVHGDRLYITWATTNDAIKAGEDFDIAIRSFDGEHWGPVTEATVSGDESLPGPWERTGSSRPVAMDPAGLPTGFSPLSDWRPARVRMDNDPRFVEYRHRLYVSWRMIPDFRFYGYMVVYMKVVEDYDTDGDGVADTADVFPDSPADWRDSDGDGVGDNTDPAPHNPDIWTMSQARPAPEPENPVAPLVLLLLLGASTAYFLRPSRKGGER
ncbi:MAG: hypothetical protein FJ149_10320 [Euryarchaeota archaeon]|nr:hypothetical protein [Euryarchaeota archaeon]